MKKLRFKSIYMKFVVEFLAIFWILNGITFIVISVILFQNKILEFTNINKNLKDEIIDLRIKTSVVFIIIALIGTIVILLALRNIVRPIKKLSKASMEVAKGNFDVNITSKSIDEIGRLTDDFNKMIESLKSIEILRMDFVSNVSHEFRTPMTSIKGFAKLLKDEKIIKEKRNEYVDIIISESERLIDLSSNLLRISELDSKVIQEKKSEFSLDEQIRKTIVSLEPLWSSKNIEFNLEIEKVEYYGEEDLMMQVWYNIIENAIKFSKIDGNIKIELFKENEKIIISFEDNGIGISQNDQKLIFEKFHKSQENDNGNGLGLAIVKKIIEISNGNIMVESTEGKGSKFVVELSQNKN